VIGTSRRRAMTVAVVTAALAASALAVAPSAEAGPPGHWTRLTTTHLGNVAEPSLVRFGSKLEVVWTQDDTVDTASIRARAITLAGAAQSTHTVVSGWSGLVDDPSVILTGGHLLVAFGGARTLDQGEKYDGPLAYATSNDGASFALGAGALTHTKDASSDYGMDAIDAAGTPYVSVVAGSSDHVTLHRGFDTSFPASTADQATSGTGQYAYSSALARDSHTAQVFAAWYSSGTGKDGIWAQRVWPSMGGLVKAPGSTTSHGSLQPDQRVALAARPGGGVWAAYVVGWPMATKIRLWKVGTSTYRDIKAPGAKEVALTPGLSGRLWVAWNDNNSVKAVRSNKSVSRFGAVRTAAGPSAKAYGSIYKIAIAGAKGPLDVVVNADVPGKNYQALYHTQMYAPLSVKLSRTSVHSASGGSVTVTVTEAGAGVAGARVRFGGVSVRTNSHGRAVVKVKKHASKGKKVVTVSLTYYVTTRATIKVT
jgi:hypothetical protein